MGSYSLPNQKFLLQISSTTLVAKYLSCNSLVSHDSSNHITLGGDHRSTCIRVQTPTIFFRQDGSKSKSAFSTMHLGLGSRVIAMPNLLHHSASNALIGRSMVFQSYWERMADAG